MTEYPHLQPDDLDLLLKSKVELMLQALDICCLDHCADITITVEHTNGTKVVADLCTHAALVEGLKDALNYFISEL